MNDNMAPQASYLFRYTSFQILRLNNYIFWLSVLLRIVIVRISVIVNHELLTDSQHKPKQDAHLILQRQNIGNHVE